MAVNIYKLSGKSIFSSFSTINNWYKLVKIATNWYQLVPMEKFSKKFFFFISKKLNYILVFLKLIYHRNGHILFQAVH